jgi:hypothetical protein
MNNNGPRPKNNNTNALIGEALGPNVYRLRSGIPGSGQYVFLNPSSLANLLGVNVRNLNNTLNRKGNNNTFEKVMGNYGLRVVENPYIRGPITKKNIKKMAGPSNPVNVNYSVNLNKAHRNAEKLKKAQNAQAARVKRREAREAWIRNKKQKARAFFTRGLRVVAGPVSDNRTIQYLNNNNRERQAILNFNRRIENIIARGQFGANNFNIMPYAVREPYMTRLTGYYDQYKELGKRLRLTPRTHIRTAFQLRRQMKNLRSRMENNAKKLVGVNAANIGRLSNNAFKNKIYTIIHKANGLPERTIAAQYWRRRRRAAATFTNNGRSVL